MFSKTWIRCRENELTFILHDISSNHMSASVVQQNTQVGFAHSLPNLDALRCAFAKAKDALFRGRAVGNRDTRGGEDGVELIYIYIYISFFSRIDRKNKDPSYKETGWYCSVREQDMTGSGKNTTDTNRE